MNREKTEQKNITIYAPVMIPTLCRYEHFKRCFESIERCTGAEKTDIYIGLDYPPSEKYVEGWKKIDSYLKEKETQNGFRNLVVRRRNHNCGVCKEGSNYQLLVQEIEKVSDRYIVSEDDNEFSPNFLEYMNKGLEFYKDDSRVLHISAYTPPIFKRITDNNTFFGIDTPAYGLGCWTHKTAADLFSNSDLECCFRSFPLKTLKLYWMWPSLLEMALNMVMKKRDYGEVRYSMYNYFHQSFTLQPSISISRNWGFDGSGIHCGVAENRELEEIQLEQEFLLQDIPYEYPKNMLKKLFTLNMPKNKLKFVKRMLVTLTKLVRFYCSCK